MEKAFLQFSVDKKTNQNVPLKIMPKFATATQNANAVLVTIQNKKKNMIVPIVRSKN